MIVTWHQPWYQELNCLTRRLEQSELDNKAERFRTDTISSEECKIIKKNWKKFRKMFGVPNKPICLARWRNKDKCRSPSTPEEIARRFVVSFLAQGLERNLYQVYKHVVSYYGSPTRGRYREYEENVMRVCLYHYPKYACLYSSAVLGRDPRGIYKRLEQLCNGKPDRKPIKWTLTLATKFLKLLLNYTGETVVDNLKQRKFDKSVWLQIENDMDQQYLCLQRFWYDGLHAQLFVKADVKGNKIIKRVLKILRLFPYKVWSDIRWKEVAKHFPDAFSHRFLYQRCYKFAAKSFDGLRTHPLEEVISKGIELIKSRRNKRLKTLVFNENQELEIIRYPNKLKF
ncbi:uncharacterized protein LOC112044260 isoform X2 [Bicyclus anynana]|nr:uncharacterized protein LOC112044260 isoform X2 [Bicyclus anynana]